MLHRTAVLLISLVAVVGCARPQPADYRASASDVDKLRAAMGGAAAASAGPKELANPTGWATLKGRFRLSGPVSLAPIVVTKDQGVCGNTAPNQSLILGPDNAVQYVLIYLNTKLPALGAPWVHPDYAATANDTVEFDQKKCIFLSHVFPMRSTQKLNVVNSDVVGHNTNIKAFGYDTIIPAGSSNNGAAVKALSEPAPTSCAIHPWMAAYIMATPHPYIAVTDNNGEFEIKNVPAGVELEFRFWHEQTKYITNATDGGKPVTWPKGRKKLTLQNDAVETIDAVLDADKFK
jgi:hypothetical protein